MSLHLAVDSKGDSLCSVEAQYLCNLIHLFLNCAIAFTLSTCFFQEQSTPKVFQQVRKVGCSWTVAVA